MLKEVIVVKCGHVSGPQPNMTGVLIRRWKGTRMDKLQGKAT